VVDRSLPAKILWAAGLVLLQGAGTGVLAAVVFVIAFVLPPPNYAPESAESYATFGLVLGGYLLTGWAVIYVPIAVVLARGIYLLRPWARGATLLFEAVQVLVLLGILGLAASTVTLGTFAWLAVIASLPITVIALLLARGVDQVFTASGPSGWRF
jgi:hypothetical protein